MTTKLPETWVLWYHSLTNNNWSINGYKKIYTIKTVEDFWNVTVRLNITIIQNGMFFLMKENIEPLWENKDNINGGCWSYKISKKDCYMSLIEIFMAVCGDSLVEDKYINVINGVSISPKRNYCIVKIWNNDYSINDVELLSKDIYNLNTSLCLYKAHKERNA